MPFNEDVLQKFLRHHLPMMNPAVESELIAL